MKTYFLYISVLTILFVNLTPNRDKSIQISNDLTQLNDSISIWIATSKNKDLKIEESKRYLEKAYAYSLLEKNDSLQNAHLLKISFAYYKLNDSLGFRKVNKKAIDLSIKINDSLSLAANYWDLGRFYSKKVLLDSAYFSFSKAQSIYEALNNDHYSGRMFLNMAIAQSDIKDFTGSEITTIKAIALLKPLRKYMPLYKCYNNIGICFNNLEEFDKSIENHMLALRYQANISRKNTFKENTLNNIGVVYKNKGNYEQAIHYYREALTNHNLKNENGKLYATVLDNLAYSKLKINDTVGIKNLFDSSLKIRDSISDYLGIAINKLHLAEYYAIEKDTIKAILYAKEARQLASSTKNYRDLLSSLLLLSKLDKENNAIYTTKYIQLNDSLQKQERTIRNKFARIQFETNEVISKNIRLNKQKNLILQISGLILLFIILLYIIISQRVKNKNLKFEHEQQKANEEIYNLMISQQNKLDEGSKKEKKRISEELHDGVLGKLFGARLILGNLNTNNSEEAILKREKYINDLQDIEEEIRNVSHTLNNQALISNIGYNSMIEKLLENQSQITNFDYDFKSDKNIEWETSPGILKMNLFRIIQEAVQNINKYAKADKVLVEFKLYKKKLQLIIKDNGIGFNVNVKKEGIGLKNIRSRTDKINGKLSISSEHNKGTLIIIRLPY